VSFPTPPSRGWDIHSHLVPAVDDGVSTVEEAINAVLALKALGYTGCITTPHIYKDIHNNTSEQLRKGFELVRAELVAQEIDFQIALAAEYFADRHLMALAESEPLLSFGDTHSKFVLIEFPYIGEPLDWADTLSVLTRAGYQPVIAHPERYRYFAADCGLWLDRFSYYPVSYQCDIGSLGKQYGPSAYRTAKQLLDRGIPAFWGSDLHRISHVARFVVPGLKHLGAAGHINPLLEQIMARHPQR
jgi:protein-tyrosine phosphatase